MGMITDMKIAEWQERAGIKPATGQYAKDLEEMSQAAFELIKVIEAERSGIRDGDGYWHGSDVLSHSVDDITEPFERIRRRDADAYALASPAAEDALPF
jgi:hypothetical protein